MNNLPAEFLFKPVFLGSEKMELRNYLYKSTKVCKDYHFNFTELTS